METYSGLRAFADSWMLLALVVIFVVIFVRVVFARRGKYRDTADIPFRHEDRPAPDRQDDASHRDEDKEGGK